MLVAIVQRQRARAATRKAHAEAGGKKSGADSAYAAAFARVRLVRAWIGVAAATVALCFAFAQLLDHVLP